ncbi:TRANSPORTER, MFS superfamily [Sinorhizobium sojae CCBAU 05684]|uniref:TRANSPORTER, MFS superfamily n=1 Tax=Sinorhizobium sojae CCBAU 05684 TaxID=716928 RepID=A0A249PE52_9HYPH|nr:TRANSPORTER, MFS superfamily [Sinorhizobium sojae CCBAU 05684]
MRGTAEGYPTIVLGLLGTSWASGFVLGCFFAPNVVKRIGHVRAFSVFTALTAIIALMTGVMIDPVSWVVLRAVTGFSTAGTSMIIESWLNERATNESRGVIFSLYIAITLVGVVGGQMMIPFGETSTTFFFMICGILYCVAMLPTLLSKAATPQPLQQVRLDLRGLYRNSPVSFLGILLVGTANGAFGTLGAVFGRQAGLSDSTVATMMSVAIFSGAVMQLPAGRISDRVDRRYVLAVLAGVAALAGLLLFLFEPGQVWIVLTMIAIYGAAANALYPIAVSHANDFATAEDFVKVSGGLLLLYGIGTIIGPTIGGPVMTAAGPYGLFMITAAAHMLITVYAIVRSRRRAPVPVAERETFSPVNAGTATTPESLQLSPRAAPLDEPHEDADGVEEEQEEKEDEPV